MRPGGLRLLARRLSLRPLVLLAWASGISFVLGAWFGAIWLRPAP